MKVDEEKLLTVFDDREVVDDEAAMYRYKKHDNKTGYTCTLVIFIYDQFFSLTLDHKELPCSIFHIGFNEVKEIEVKDNSLYITLENNSITSTFYFSPNFSLKMQFGRLRKVYTYTMYDNAKLCKLFKINRDEVKINNGFYSFQYKNGNYIFALSFAPQKRHAIIVLKDINLQLPLYEITINNISTIEAINEKPERLLIHLWNSDQILQVVFNSCFLLNIGEQEWLNEINAYRNL